jgi:hypothetical protein
MIGRDTTVFVYLYFMVTKSVVNATTRDTIFAAMTGASAIMMPYTSHNMLPIDTMSGMNREISLASLSFQMRIICGNSEKVVNKAAT